MMRRQDDLYWSLIYEFVTRHDYQIIRLSDDEREILLDPYKNKEFQIVRLVRMDLDWGSQLQQDIETTAVQIDHIRKQSWKHPIQILNIYITTYPPVDDWEFRIDKPHQFGQTTLKSVLIDKESGHEGVRFLEKFLHVPLSIPSENEFIDTNELKVKAILYSNRRIKEEKQIFHFGKPVFTYLFTAIQVFMFMLLEASGGSQNTDTLVKFGAKSNTFIIDGEWWRFITPVFLHIGFLHLLMNTLALVYIGGAVERMYGSGKFLFIYLFAVAAGSIASFALSPSISAGASGAIFGCFGALLYLGISNRKLFFRTIGSNLIFIIGLNLLFGFAVPNIDNAGHIGGLLGGFLAALIVQLPKQNKWGLRLAGIVLSLIFMAAAYTYGLQFTEMINMSAS